MEEVRVLSFTLFRKDWPPAPQTQPRCSEADSQGLAAPIAMVPERPRKGANGIQEAATNEQFRYCSTHGGYLKRAQAPTASLGAL